MANNRYNQGVNQALLGWAPSEWCIFPEKQWAKLVCKHEIVPK